MIDERSRGGVIIKHSGMGGRLGESVPDYEDSNKDYNFADNGKDTKVKKGYPSQLTGILKSHF